MIANAQGGQRENGSCNVDLAEAVLTISPESGAGLMFSWRDIAELKAADYKVFLTSLSGDRVEFSSLGYQYEDFLRIASALRNKMLIKDSLLDEPLKKSQIEAHYSFQDAAGIEKAQGQCELRIYETALLLVPDGAGMKRFSFRDAAGVQAGDRELSLTLDSGEKLLLSKFGAQFDYFKTHLSEQMNQMLLMGQKLLKSIMPDLDGLALRKASLVLKEGWLLPLSEIEKICPGFFARLEKTLGADPENKKEFALLKSLSRQERICFGFKKGLGGGASEDYFLLLFPVYSADPAKPGNAVAMEAFRTEQENEVIGENAGKRATYFFRLTSRKDYPLTKDISGLDEKMTAFTRFFNAAMSAVNFRRAPLFLSDSKLEEPRYARYRAAVARIPELRALRDVYIGRVIHSSSESWIEDISNLLAFNIHSNDDRAKWLKSQLPDAAEEKIDNEELLEEQAVPGQEKK
ncbi:MAG: hypothetical protein M0R70_05580 [Nitrospirae bacterium]|nr:hypothetical protein [Nitrospirota bacterium]